LRSLIRGKIRQSMHKQNVYNLYKMNLSYPIQNNLFRQKWVAKQLGRGYHGEHITEHKWKGYLSDITHAMVPLDKVRKSSVGTLKAALSNSIPAQMWMPLEKRLDTAVFRSFFASSIRQAKQYITSGHVRVNGTVIRHPFYELKPGDMFSVTPERVLAAIGRKAVSAKEAKQIDMRQYKRYKKYVDSCRKNPEKMYAVRATTETATIKDATIKDATIKDATIKDATIKDATIKDVATASAAAESVATEDAAEAEAAAESSEPIVEVKSESKSEPSNTELTEDQTKQQFINEELDIIVSSDSNLRSKFRNLCYLYSKDANMTSREIKKSATAIVSDIIDLRKRKLAAERTQMQNNYKNGDPTAGYTPDWYSDLEKTLESLEKDIDKLSDDYEGEEGLKFPWQKGLFGRQNPEKPYFTPWKPRQFLAPTLVLPSHIEISFKTCHAVYLRDPVARPGMSEVISPFSPDFHRLAKLYYGRK
ncbi:hypothetical protein CANCADRAFT_14309, partial [Tortispora caseinolytica NRRL Y-17796]